MDFAYSFPAVIGVQAGHQYYIAMLPLRMLAKLFEIDGDYIQPELRAQRRLNKQRIPEMKSYILDNPDTYVFSALAASVDGEMEFLQFGNGPLGTLNVSIDATLLINDGQHRVAAILEALKERESLGSETISVVLFKDLGLSRSQQMFTDLNKHAVRTTNSIAELYDSRDSLAVVTRNTIRTIKLLNKYTDKERDNLGKNSA
jgi:DNA sulfur modification protein DndB